MAFCRLKDNKTSRWGGAIFNGTDGTLQMSNCEFTATARSSGRHC